MRSAVLTFLLFLSLHAARGEPPWQTLPPTPAPVPGEHIGHAKVNGISLYYATIGHGSPVVLLPVVSPTRTIGATRSRLSLRVTTSSSRTAAGMAAARATPAHTATTSWSTTWSPCSTRYTSPRPTWWAGATAASLAFLMKVTQFPPPIDFTPRRLRPMAKYAV